ncbi:MAG: 3-oxoacyl-ACP reductase FabG [Clostridia bacterium]|nr:3-oxoacyl-ACP reductase FabG [Clostridia bacterium]MBQ4618743.1 3-oxoacyl-ACP reductase FabG [Clostridia bacterium]
MMNAIVSGGSRGIGAAVVRMLTESGVRVAFLYEKNENAAREIARSTGAVPVRCDISDRDQVFRAYEEAKKAVGMIDSVVSCAGIAQQALFQDVTGSDWNKMIGVNLSGAAYLAQAALPDMISEKKGSIVFVSSIWGEVGASMEAHYSASKAGLIGLMKALSKEVGPSGIRVNAVTPGVIYTDMLKCFDDETMRCLAEETPLGRIGTPEDVAKAIRFLLSDDASFITGQTLGVNGGFGM